MAIETFQYRGAWWTRIPAAPINKFALGCDLGQSNDFTAVSVIEHICEPLDTWTEIRRPDGNMLLKQDAREEFHVRHLERLPLNVPYPEQVNRVREILARRPLRNSCDFILDQSGVGAPVADLFEADGLRPVRIVIGAGFESVKHAENKFTVPKIELVGVLDAAIGGGALKIASALSESPVLREEFQDFRKKISDSGRASYSARGTAHDDILMCLAIALWWLRRPKRGEFSQGTVMGAY